MSAGEKGVGDGQLDRLLGARIREPSADFEERLDRLIAGSGEAPGRVLAFPTWAVWAGGLGAAAAALVLGLFLSGGFDKGDRFARAADPSYEELFVLEEGVGDALPLTDPLILEAILNMPVGAET